jgi:glutamine synthetase
VHHDNYALANPVTLITGKGKKDLTREDLLKVISEKQIERLTFHYTGIDGKIKELRLPIASRRQAELILTEGERVDGSSLFKGMVDIGRSDLYVVPVYSSAFLNPFDNGSLDFICRFFDSDGNPAKFAPDNVLHAAHKLLKDETGLELYALGELEFYLLRQPQNYLYQLAEQKGYHATAPFAKSGNVLNEMVKYITQIYGSVKYAHHEVGSLQYVESEYPEIHGKAAEQVEIEFLPTPVEEAADMLILARWIIRTVAYHNDCLATFVPKLEEGHAGNGMHVHIALMKDGKNIMTGSDGELSNEAMCVIGGLCHYTPSLTAFGNMLSASYLRLVPNQEAPTKVCWSEFNRSALIRVPLGWGGVNNLASNLNLQQKEQLTDIPGRQTVELRSPDGSANAHLLIAGITMAVEWGLQNQKRALEKASFCHVDMNIHDNDYFDMLPEISSSCVESSEKLLQKRDHYERNNIFPHNLIDYVINTLHSENDRDLNRRLLSLPEGEKQRESRRIMHRDIHRN